MEVTNWCSNEECHESITVSGPFCSHFFEIQKRLLVERGWQSVECGNGKRKRYCPKHAPNPAEEREEGVV